MNQKLNKLLLPLIIISSCWAVDNSKIIDSMLEGVQEVTKGKATADYTVSIALQNEREGGYHAEVHTVRMNGKLLIPVNSGYLYKGLKDESSRVVWLDLMVTDRNGKTTPIQARTEIPREHGSLKILIQVTIDYINKKAKTVVF